MSYTKNIISIIPMLVLLYGQNYSQWQQTNLPYAVKVNTIVIRDSSIYAGTDGEGIFVSIDNGENWNSLNEGLQSKVIHAIFFNGKKVFAGTNSGAFTSTDNGLTWSTVNSGLSDKPVWSFAAGKSMSGDSIIFAGTWNGVYSSADSGINWQATALSDTKMPVHTIVVYENTIYAATLADGVFFSDSYGSSWKDISIRTMDILSGTYPILPVYALVNIDKNILACGGDGNFYHTAYGNPVFITDSSLISKDKPILCFGTRNAKLFAGNTKGDIFSSNSDGTLWKKNSNTLKNQTIYSLALDDFYIFAGTGTGVWRLLYPENVSDVNKVKETPAGFALEQNYPNPFNSSTIIRFTIPYSGNVSLKIYNALGKLVDDLVDKYMTTGTYDVEFLPHNLPSGVFFYSLVTNEFRSTKKLILLK